MGQGNIKLEWADIWTVLAGSPIWDTYTCCTCNTRSLQLVYRCPSDRMALSLAKQVQPSGSGIVAKEKDSSYVPPHDSENSKILSKSFFFQLNYCTSHRNFPLFRTINMCLLCGSWYSCVLTRTLQLFYVSNCFLAWPVTHGTEETKGLERNSVFCKRVKYLKKKNQKFGYVRDFCFYH